LYRTRAPTWARLKNYACVRGALASVPLGTHCVAWRTRGQYAVFLSLGKACPLWANRPEVNLETKAAHALDKSFSSALRSGLATRLGAFKASRNREVIL